MSEAKKTDDDEMLDWPDFVSDLVDTLGEFYPDLTSEMVTGWLREFLESLTPEEKAADDYQSTINERIRENLLERSRQFILETESKTRADNLMLDEDLNIALRLSEEAEAEAKAEIQAAEQNLLNENLTGTQLFMRLSEDRRLTIGLIISQLSLIHI